MEQERLYNILTGQYGEILDKNFRFAMVNLEQLELIG